LDENLVARPLADVSFHLVAAPAYLERAGRSSELRELNGHSLLKYGGISCPDGTFTVRGPAGPETIRFQITLESYNETLLHLAALEGMGIALLPEWMISTDIDEGRLEVVLANALQVDSKLFAVYPPQKYLSAKVRTFIDFLANDPRLR
jgi:DNA-binding transcriptional LysR family regulator